MAEMTKQKLLDIVSKAIDEGFKVDLSFYSGGTKEQAKDKLERVISGYDLPSVFDTNGKSGWYSTYDEEEQSIEVTVYLGE
ncbi:hypothetical protein P8864_10380 [Priestia flexa]|uniref:hypothetical protein n=1 Tax=Priestia flexa TaxID=86664 RepID=UPI000C2471AF|nr:hypothetical protein [Priestia flexa]MEC0666295.1 hypothetical protein [Priestia flexa]